MRNVKRERSYKKQTEVRNVKQEKKKREFSK